MPQYKRQLSRGGMFYISVAFKRMLRKASQSDEALTEAVVHYFTQEPLIVGEKRTAKIFKKIKVGKSQVTV